MSRRSYRSMHTRSSLHISTVLCFPHEGRNLCAKLKIRIVRAITLAEGRFRCGPNSRSRHSLIPREYGVELPGLWIEPFDDGKRIAPELKFSPMIFSCQPAPNARQPELSFARHASAAIIVAQRTEPGD